MFDANAIQTKVMMPIEKCTSGFSSKQTVMVVHWKFLCNPITANKPKTHKVIQAGMRRRMGSNNSSLEIL